MSTCFLKLILQEKKPLITEDDIPAFYFSRSYNQIKNDDDEVKNTVVAIKSKHSENYSYSKTMLQLSQIAQDAKRNLDARRILRSVIDDHQKLLLKKEDCLDPPKIPSFGKPEIYPSRNADIIKRKSKSGRQKK